MTRISDSDWFEQTALHLAAMFLKDEAAETLVALGADPAARDYRGRCALIAGARLGS